MRDPIIYLPSGIIDSHCHGRDMGQAQKTTIKQTTKEAQRGNIDITIYMPNTDPPIIDIETLDKYGMIIDSACEEIGIAEQQYVFFGATDENILACKEALKRSKVAGIKVYPKSESGKTVTTGTIGVARDITILHLLNLSEISGKPVAFHCDDPEIIAREGNTIQAEAAYVEKILTFALDFPRSKIVICHVSCIESAYLVLKAQGRGIQVALELCPHHLWFDADGTNWNPDLDPVFYHCYNNLRQKNHREYLAEILADGKNFIIISSDNAPHMKEEKLEKKFGGLPSNQEMVAVVLTLAHQMGISNQQVIRLLCLNAANFFRIPIRGELRPYRLEKRFVDATYNNGVVVNPWLGAELYFPVPV
jgi:dihydroorotase-like cyclic amidohydrolase